MSFRGDAQRRTQDDKVGSAERQAERRDLVGGAAPVVALRRVGHPARLRLSEPCRGVGVIERQNLAVTNGNSG